MVDGNVGVALGERKLVSSEPLVGADGYFRDIVTLAGGRPIRVRSGFFPIARHKEQRHAGVMNTTASEPESSIDAEPADQARPGAGHAGTDLIGGLKDLRRPVDGRLLGGVAAGIARYLGTDVNIVRLVFVALACLGGAALPLYVAGWLLIPEDGADQSIVGELFSSLENRSR